MLHKIPKQPDMPKRQYQLRAVRHFRIVTSTCANGYDNKKIEIKLRFRF